MIMKSPLIVLGCILCLLINIYAEQTELTTLAVSTRIFFKGFLFLSLYVTGKLKLSISFIAFSIMIIMIDLFAYSQGWEYTFYALSIGMYVVLFHNVWKQFKMNRLNYTLWSFVGVLLINGLLIGIHINSLIYSYQGDDVIIYLQILYTLVLYLMITIAIAYYLNSYSKKALLFLIGSIVFLCMDILYGTYSAYGAENFMLPFRALLSAAGYVLFFNYFQMKEMPLFLDSDILEEIEAMEQHKELRANFTIKRQAQG